MNKKILASIIDNTLLKTYATKEDIVNFVKESIELGSNICICETRIEDAKKVLEENNAKNTLCCVIGFPNGTCTTEMKVFSAKEVLEKGVDEIDMVINVGFLKDRDERFKKDIFEVAKVVKQYNKILKVIIETCYLDEEEKKIASKTVKDIAQELKLHMFVKTSTGLGPEGAKAEDIKLIKETIGEFDMEKNPVGIKAAGSIKTLAVALKMFDVSGYKEDGNLKDRFRIGSSKGTVILTELNNI